MCIPVKCNTVNYATVTEKKGKGIEKVRLQPRNLTQPLCRAVKKDHVQKQVSGTSWKEMMQRERGPVRTDHPASCDGGRSVSGASLEGWGSTDDDVAVNNSMDTETSFSRSQVSKNSNSIARSDSISWHRCGIRKPRLSEEMQTERFRGAS